MNLVYFSVKILQRLCDFDLFFNQKKIRANVVVVRVFACTIVSRRFQRYEICYWHLHQLLRYSLQTIENFVQLKLTEMCIVRSGVRMFK